MRPGVEAGGVVPSGEGEAGTLGGLRGRRPWARLRGRSEEQRGGGYPADPGRRLGRHGNGISLLGLDFGFGLGDLVEAIEDGLLADRLCPFPGKGQKPCDLRPVSARVRGHEVVDDREQLGVCRGVPPGHIRVSEELADARLCRLGADDGGSDGNGTAGEGNRAH